MVAASDRNPSQRNSSLTVGLMQLRSSTDLDPTCCLHHAPTSVRRDMVLAWGAIVELPGAGHEVLPSAELL